jgi:tetratricopeptide (TPR) repeat protein
MTWPTLLAVAAALAVAPYTAAAAPQQPAAPAHDMTAMDARPATLISGIQGVHFAISTRRAEAQKFFDQGMALVYAFNHEEAVRSFRRAAEIDPASPMPHWGIALALGPNINLDVDPAREQAAYDSVQRAVTLAARAPAKERAYVAALAKRYSNDPAADLKALAVAYKDAMRQLMRTYPNDMHAATLFAESLMDLHPWALYTADGTPTEGTKEIVDVLEHVIEREPDHVGANHYYIPATEASLTPERALKSAKKLETLVPAAGHLVHMPAHTYMRTGNYSGAVTANARAAEVDRQYIRDTGGGAVYSAMYFNHNLDFLASAAMMGGQYEQALAAARELTTNVLALLPEMPMVEPFGAKTMLVQLRFAKWQEVLALPKPPGSAPILTALFHFGRSVAQAGLGSLADADAERQAYAPAKQALPNDAMFNLNPAATIFAVADHVLDARIAAARGDSEAAIAAWRLAVAAEDAVAYNEPPDWFYPTRESLGAALFRARRLDEADLAFREDLERNPNNGRSLWGRWQVLRASDGDVPGTLVVRRRFQDAWIDADTQLRLEDF